MAPIPPTPIGMPPPRLSSIFSLWRSPIHRMAAVLRHCCVVGATAEQSVIEPPIACGRRLRLGRKTRREGMRMASGWGAVVRAPQSAASDRGPHDAGGLHHNQPQPVATAAGPPGASSAAAAACAVLEASEAAASTALRRRYPGPPRVRANVSKFAHALTNNKLARFIEFLFIKPREPAQPTFLGASTDPKHNFEGFMNPDGNFWMRRKARASC
jgi:hypothetical protein